MFSFSSFLMMGLVVGLGLVMGFPRCVRDALRVCPQGALVNIIGNPPASCAITRMNCSFKQIYGHGT